MLEKATFYNKSIENGLGRDIGMYKCNKDWGDPIHFKNSYYRYDTLKIHYFGFQI
jgi:hypothetical protein